MNLLIHNVNLICRVCLNNNIDLHDIFTKNESSYTIAFSLMECAPVEISPDDGLPHQICTECLEKIQYVQQFKNQIITSDATLRQYFQNFNETKPDIDIDYNGKDQEQIDIKPDIHVSLNNVHVKEEDMPTAVNESKEDLIKPIKSIKKRRPRKKTPNKLKVDKNSDDLVVKVPRKKAETRKKYDRCAGGPFKCDQCEQTCITKSKLLYHQRVHTGEKPHMCDFCGKSFAWSSYLISHRRIHTKEYRYQCDFCSKQFVHSTEHKEHIRVHTGERPYKCNECERSFKQHSQLRVHQQRIHEKIFKFECDTCQKRFKTKCVMIKHKLVHTGERPHECPLCLKRFAQNAGLLYHNRTVHNVISTRPLPLETDKEKKLLDK